MKYIAFALVLLPLMSCSDNEKDPETITHTTTSTEDSGIKEEYRNEIADLNAIVIESILNNDINGLDQVKSKNLENQDEQEFKEAFYFINDQLITEPQSIFKECWAKKSMAGTDYTLFKKYELGQIIDTVFYEITYSSPQKESYLSVLRMKSEYCERLLTLIYGKYDSEWKLDYMSVGNFKINGLTSPEHRLKAQQFYDNDELIPALNTILTSQMCSLPMYELLSFEDSEENNKFAERIVKDVENANPFPIDLDPIGISGEIIKISQVPLKSGQYFPFVSYITSIPLNESEKVLQENIKVHSKIENILPGIKKGYSGIIYGFYNENPELEPSATTYNMLRENNE